MKKPSMFEISEIRQYVNLNLQNFYCSLSNEEKEGLLRYGEHSREYTRQLLFMQKFYVLYINQDYVPTCRNFDNKNLFKNTILETAEEREFLKNKILEYLKLNKKSINNMAKEIETIP